MASFIYNKMLERLFAAGVDFTAAGAQTFKVALLNNTYGGGETERDGHNFFSNVSAFEIAATGGYTAGGKAIANVDVTRDDATNKSIVDGDDVTWATSTMTFRWGVIYRDTGVAGTSPLLKLIDFGVEQSTSGTDFTIVWSASGIFADQQAA